MYERWVRGAIGQDSDLWVTLAGCRKVLVMVPTVTAGTRLTDVLTLLRGDRRIQTLYTVPETFETWHGAAEFTAATGGLVVPWHQAVNQNFDLVLAATMTGLDQVRGQVMLLPHGAGSLMSRKYSPWAGRSARPHTGLARETLTKRGKLLLSALALTHDDELRVLRRTCPEALPVAVVAGDICYDRMVVSMSRYPEYREALGVAADQTLVTISSTWSTDSIFGRQPDLCRDVVREVADSGHRAALVLHPHVWAAHGKWQIHSWLAECLDNGLLLIPPQEGWQAAIVASDYVVGDFGSTTQYAAAIGKPVTLATFPDHKIRSGSLAHRLAKLAPRLDVRQRLLPQLRQANPHAEQVACWMSSRQGRSASILRHTMYQLLQLTEPKQPAALPPVPSPCPVPS
ncbi:hypothetical protein LWC34_25850 [Kibdelosporangium philippinense]|uniref:CDP-Glycerol:Poly(Glycerophosphate) glycerophosphotransferase n=1 Tax=Kibdelosporangium philippinense TaxID=211113 RepID=A0ABS8ZHZ0_9PSEU|nr:hypothetical protein [Kibdelosporangium philippinense]MCE7006236.1 hypothetical protein [Kibdelosporangium philippinense]